MFVLVAARRHLMATRRRLHVYSAMQEGVMKWPKVLPGCGWVTSGAATYRRFAARCGTILRHRQRSATDEQRDNRETFHFNSMLEPHSPGLADENSFKSRPFQVNWPNQMTVKYERALILKTL